jgi:hypothetical protein
MRLKLWTGQLTIEELKTFKETALAVEYKVNRETVRAARKEVIAGEYEYHYLMRPVVRGLCRSESLVDGTLDLGDILRMNRALDRYDGLVD